jgi:hypothetical protein
MAARILPDVLCLPGIENHDVGAAVRHAMTREQERNAMRKILVLMAAIGLSGFVAFDAGALPLSPAKHGFAASDTTLIQVCPRGYRWSERRERCVPDDRAFEGCPRGFRWSNSRQRCVPEERVRDDCPPGFRFSESRQACVPRF